MWRVVLGGVEVLLAASVVVGAYVAFSAFILWIAGRVLPLIGRRGRD